MKRKNLFLSLICSIALTIALVTVTVISIVPKKDKGAGNGSTSTNVSDTGNVGDNTSPDVTINEDRDGSAEKPYVIYDAETFKAFIVDKYLDENGNYINYLEKDGDGNFLYPELADGLYYELDADIDFAGQEAEVLFNKRIAFNGHIKGNGHALKNITFNVTKENFVEDYTYTRDGQLIANIGLFGEVYKAEITDLSITGLQIVCEDGLYTSIANAEFDIVKSVSVGAIAGIAYDSTIEVTVDAKMDAFAYAVYSENKANGSYAVGGVVGVASGCAINNTTVKVEMTADEGTAYYVGGVAGAAFKTTIENAKVDAKVETYAKQALKVAGVVGYAQALQLNTADVKLAVVALDENRLDTDAVTQIDSDKYASVAGIVARISVPSASKTSKIENVTVVSTADIDATFAGAVMDVVLGGNATGTTKYVEIKDVIVDSDVKVLKAFGFAKYLVNTKVELNLAKVAIVKGVEREFNVRLTGSASLDKDVVQGVVPVEVFMTMERSANNEIVNGLEAVKVIVSQSIALNAYIAEGFGSYVVA